MGGSRRRTTDKSVRALDILFGDEDDLSAAKRDELESESPRNLSTSSRVAGTSSRIADPNMDPSRRLQIMDLLFETQEVIRLKSLFLLLTFLSAIVYDLTQLENLSSPCVSPGRAARPALACIWHSARTGTGARTV